MEETKIKINIPRCSKCNSTQIRYKYTTNERVCNQCGHIEKINSKEKFEDESMW